MMLAILLGCFGFASLCFLLLPLVRKTSPARDSFDEQNHRKTLYRDQVSELREGLGDEALLPELEDELGTVFLTESSERLKAERPAKPERNWISIVYGVTAGMIVLLGSLTYWIVGGADLMEVEGAEKLLMLDPVRDAFELEQWSDRLKDRLDSNHEDGKSWYLLGHAYLKRSEYTLASSAFSQADRVFGSDLNVLNYWLQSRYLVSGNIDARSREIIEEILSIEPSNTTVAEILGVDALKNGNADLAIKELSRVISASDNPSKQMILASLVSEARKTLTGNQNGVLVNVSSSSEMSDGFLFMVARPVGGGMPYAVVKRPTEMLPFSVVLDDLVSMQSTRRLSQADSFEVLIRYSSSGTIGQQRGDAVWTSKTIFKGNLHSRVEINADLGPKESTSG